MNNQFSGQNACGDYLTALEQATPVITAKGGFVNLHLFVSPEDPQHLDELRRLLSRLQFNVVQHRFDCTRADLIRLGKKADSNIADEQAALAYGANQFKVNFQKLREVFSESGWAKKNILIAVAGGATDGTSGVREAADQTIRREIEGFAHVIFARRLRSVSSGWVRKTSGPMKSAPATAG